MKSLISAALLALPLALGASAASAQAYPSKSIRWLVPYPAGGGADFLARTIGQQLSTQIGQPVVIENKPGGNTAIAASEVARAPADGYTLLVAHIGMATTATLYRNPGFKYDEFEYLGLINEVPMVVVGKPGLAAKNWAELSSWITTNKNKVNLANAGLGAASHLCGLMLQNALKTELTTVPYKGTAPAMTDLLGGQVDIMCDQTTNTTSQIEGKKVKVFAVTTAKRLNMPLLKDQPTLAESGLKDFQVTIWHGLYAPKGTPADVLAKLNTALKAALKDPEFIKKQEGLGAVVATDRRVEPAEHKKFVQAEIAKWTPIIKAAGVYAD